MTTTDTTAGVQATAEPDDVAPKPSDDAPRELTSATDRLRVQLTGLLAHAKTATVPKGALSVLIVALAATAVTFGMLWNTSSSALDDMHAQQAADTQAKDIAGKYAVSASTFDYRSLDPWKSALEKGVSDQLKPKFISAVNVLNPLLQQLQWVSKSSLIAAVVTDRTDDRYTVQVFVGMKSTTSTFPDGMNSTATYTISLDKSSEWTITDVGGIGGGLPGASSPMTPAPTAGGHK